MASPPSPPIRLTITVSAETHAVFQRLATAGNQSLGRCMGEWLEETSEAAAFMALKMEEAREKPRQVMREMHAYALGLADETTAMLTRAAAKQGALGSDALQAKPPPRPVIRGGNSGRKHT